MNGVSSHFSSKHSEEGFSSKIKCINDQPKDGYLTRSFGYYYFIVQETIDNCLTLEERNYMWES